MAATSTYPPIRTPVHLSNYAYFLDLLQQVEDFKLYFKNRAIRRVLIELLGRMGRPIDNVDRFIEDKDFRQKMMSTIRRNLNEWHEQNPDDPTIELMSHHAALELIKKTYDDCIGPNKMYSFYNDVQKILLIEETFELPLTGSFQKLLINYETKTSEKMNPEEFERAGVYLLRQAIKKDDFSKVAQLVEKGVNVSRCEIFRFTGFTMRNIKVFDALIKTKIVGFKQRLLRVVTRVAVRTKSEQLRNHLQQYGVSTNEIIAAAAYTNNMEWLQEEIEAGGDPDAGIDEALIIADINTTSLKYLLNSGADPIKALIRARYYLRTENIILMILKYIDPDFEACPEFLEILRIELNSGDHNLHRFTSILSFQKPFPSVIIERIIEAGIKISLFNALLKKNEEFIQNVLDFGSESIDVPCSIGSASRFFPKILKHFIPLLSAIPSQLQKTILHDVGKLKNSELLELLLQNPHNNFVENHPELVAQYRESAKPFSNSDELDNELD